MTRVLASILGVGLAVVSAGCPGTSGGSGGGNANRNANDNRVDNQNDNHVANQNDNHGGGVGITFRAALDGAQEVPAVQTDGEGDGEFTLSVDQQQIDFSISASGLSGPVTQAHFHAGAEGVDGNIIIDIGADVSEADGAVTIEGSAAVEADFVSFLLEGEIYVNLHTELNPGGEIRGQLEATPAPGE